MVFFPKHHQRLSEQDLGSDAYSEEAIALVKEADAILDDRTSLYKDDGRLYLHQIETVLGFTKPMDQLVQEARISVAQEVGRLLSRSERHPSERDRSYGLILFYLGSLHHMAQDYKHREGNWTAADGQPITNLDHFSIDINQLVSDGWPSNRRIATAWLRTRQETAGFEKGIIDKFGFDRGMKFISPLRKWKPGKSLKAYYPSATEWNRVFPKAGMNQDLGWDQ